MNRTGDTMNTTRIVFLHIPKTAGQSVHAALSGLVPNDAISPIRVHTQAKGDHSQMPDGYLLYSGHLDWVELHHVPSPRFAFTILRDPLERIASFYFYLRKQAEALPAEELEQPHNTGMKVISSGSAEDYFFGGDANWQRFIRDHYDNVQTTYLATRRMRGWTQVKDMSPDDQLDAAFGNAGKNLDGVYSTLTLTRLEDDLERIFRIRPQIADRRVNAGPQMQGARWPQLAKLLGPSAADRLARYTDTDRRLLDRLGLTT